MHALDDKLEPKAVRRLELITGPDGGGLVARGESAHSEETLAPGAIVSQIARRPLPWVGDVDGLEACERLSDA